MKFVFLLTIWSATSPQPDVYVEDYNLTGEDCVQMIMDYNASDPTWSRGNPSCEPDLASYD